MAKKAAEKGYEEAMNKVGCMHNVEFNGIKFIMYMGINPRTKLKTGVIENVHPE
ncbi:hypothetical protein [Neisseria sp. KEM232]|uniref:hypothetical protein n=1 Tax=Neisseria sp. KEM232 TaxID=655307 RepID=UPI0012FE298E|nr:hypothetical protein [Neisseria sp. KEM232]